MSADKKGDGVLERYSARLATSAEEEEFEPSDNLVAFGWLRGIRDRAIMLELRHKDGRITSLGYAWMERAEFDPSDGIILQFGGRTIKITGRNLNSDIRPNVRLFNGILRHRVSWVQEADGATQLESPKNAVVIELIEMK
jgi:hypothetical protein